MLLWILLFIAVAIITGILAFSGVAIAATFFSKILFFISLICMLIAVIMIIVHKIFARREIVKEILKKDALKTDIIVDED